MIRENESNRIELSPEIVEALLTANGESLPVIHPITKHVFWIIDPGNPKKAIAALRKLIETNSDD